jgi:hypothetical protein
MNWFYNRDGQQDGPHSEEALRGLVNSGQVNAATLVWQEGMANWQPLSQAAPQIVSWVPPPPPSSIGAVVQCAECGGVFPASELISLGGLSVCARCKPLRLQRMQEGVAPGGAREDLVRLLKIAKAQRGVNLAILLTFAGYGLLILGPFAARAGQGGAGAASALAMLSLVGLLVILTAVVFQVIHVYRLAGALDHNAILWVLGVIFLGCIGLLLLLTLSSKATKELRNAGFKVGLLGGKPKEIEQKLSTG